MKEIRAFVDRIEGDKAVLLIGEHEDRTVVIPADLLPDGAREGAVLHMSLRYDPRSTEDAADHIAGLIDRLRNRK